MKKRLINNLGFTLVELLVVIAIIAALAGVAIPLGRNMFTRSHAVECGQNLRQIGMATMMYAGDNNMTLPTTTHQRSMGGKSWTLTLQPYAAGTITFKCHKDPNIARGYTYAMNDFLTPNPSGASGLNFSILAKIDIPQATILFAEAAPSYSSVDHFHFTKYYGGQIPPDVFESQVAVKMHGEKGNYLFADGHVETLSWSETKARLAAAGSRFVDPSAR